VFVFVVSLYTETLQRQTKMYRDITKTNKNVQRHYKCKQKCTETLQRQRNVSFLYYCLCNVSISMHFCFLSLKYICTFLRVFVVSLYIFVVFVMSLYIFACICSVSVHFCLHYKDKQKCTETLQRQTKMYRDITKTNKNVHRHYKDKQKCTETLHRQTQNFCLSL
jgi:microsomal dipeptidase-like Zn-dependent dipeptidase